MIFLFLVIVIALIGIILQAYAWSGREGKMDDRRFRQLMFMSTEARAIAFALLDLTVPGRFLGIKGQLRKNTYALKLAGEIMQDRMTTNEAMGRLKWFNATGEIPEEAG